MRRRFTRKPSIQASRRAVKAAVSTADMLDAFEHRLSELGVNSKTNVSCSSDDEAEERSVNISGTDYQYRYEDVEGGFGEPGKVYSLAEIKEFWNKENMNDPVLADYPSYDLWWKDTMNNFLRQVDD